MNHIYFELFIGTIICSFGTMCLGGMKIFTSYKSKRKSSIGGIFSLVTFWIPIASIIWALFVLTWWKVIILSIVSILSIQILVIIFSRSGINIIDISISKFGLLIGFILNLIGICIFINMIYYNVDVIKYLFIYFSSFFLANAFSRLFGLYGRNSSRSASVIKFGFLGFIFWFLYSRAYDFDNRSKIEFLIVFVISLIFYIYRGPCLISIIGKPHYCKSRKLKERKALRQLKMGQSIFHSILYEYYGTTKILGDEQPKEKMSIVKEALNSADVISYFDSANRYLEENFKELDISLNTEEISKPVYDENLSFDKLDFAKLLHEFGILHQASGEWDKARNFYNQALAEINNPNIACNLPNEIINDFKEVLNNKINHIP